MKIEDFDPRLKKEIDNVASYAGDCNDWIRIKKEIMKRLPGKLRTNFSTRERGTYAQKLNEFEHMIIDYWKSKTDITLKLIQLWERKKENPDE